MSCNVNGWTSGDKRFSRTVGAWERIEAARAMLLIENGGAGRADDDHGPTGEAEPAHDVTDSLMLR